MRWYSPSLEMPGQGLSRQKASTNLLQDFGWNTSFSALPGPMRVLRNFCLNSASNHVSTGIMNPCLGLHATLGAIRVQPPPAGLACRAGPLP
jgi:hypothetical protein